MNLSEVLAKAKETPVPPTPPTAKEFRAVIVTLRDEKRMTWPAIADWMQRETGLSRSGSFWTLLYKSKPATPAQ